MPRILLLITDLQIGGTPTVVRELAIRLRIPGERERGPAPLSPGVVEVEVACLDAWGPVADELSAAGIHVTALNACCSADLRVVRRLGRLLDARGYDIVVSFLVHANAVAALTSLRRDHLRYFQSIQTTQQYPRWHWLIQRLARHAAEKIIVPSPSAAEVAVRCAGASADDIVVIPNAIDPDRFALSPIPSTEPRPYPIGFIGRLDPIKRVGDLVQAVGLLKDQVHLHIFGEGADRPSIEAQIRRLHLHDRVTMHGVVSRPQEALCHLGLLVLPSLAEGFGMVLIEAMAAGVPVVARDVPGVGDVIRDGDNGLLAKPYGAGPLAEAISRVLADLPLRRHLVASGLDDVRRRFTWEPTLQQYRQVLGLEQGTLRVPKGY